MRETIFKIVAFLIGAPVAFFTVFVSIFADAGGLEDYIPSVIIIVIVYGLLGFIFAYNFPKSSWMWGVWITLPAIIIVVLYSIKETTRLPLHAFFAMLPLLASSLAAYQATLMKQRKGSPQKTGAK
ncbi:MAG TPA: hypothetical protein VJC11_03745 [Patescibacteria group bacterium]|nr:hypothetical protein [Patescibacteria group bacterium]